MSGPRQPQRGAEDAVRSELLEGDGRRRLVRALAALLREEEREAERVDALRSFR